jgi:adenylate cyclase
VEPTADQVREQLDRILGSEGFANADRLSRFLRYVVERTLAGEGDLLKEYAVGVGVFDRDEQYDPRIDSIVRVEASRLRSKIDEYYRTRDGADPILIRLPKGSYVPVFEVRPPAIPSALPGQLPQTGPLNRRRLVFGVIVATIAVAGLTAWRVGLWPAAGSGTPAVAVAVLPFDVFSADPAQQLLAARLTDGVTSDLARLGTVGVVSRTTASQLTGSGRSIRELARQLGADLVLEGTVEVKGDIVRLTGRLVDGAIDRKVWVEDFVGRSDDLRDLQHRIATAVAAAAANRARAEHRPAK